ncbi:RRP12-like protein isoform X1 [Neltuma alba]|uniref:RRP12-like protein isoform X1 n=2 Tax=Neltuma alba TaxID=207710 RepID=UPI0010A46385|nr:RRP12-like protein isoform X1 [Prosopis alba]
MEVERAELFKGGSDLCQQLMDRYANSAAPQHRHLLATAAAMHSNLTAESLPLTPPAYFAAIISALDTASSSESLDPTAVSALLSFLAIDLPLVQPGGIAPARASDAVEVLVKVAEREGEGLGVSSVRAAVKCFGVLMGFCDLELWDTVRLGFEALMKFSIDKRPKVRRCAQESLEKVFKSFQSSRVVMEASKFVLSVLRSYMPLATNLVTSRTSNGSKDDMSSKPEHMEVLYVLNVLKLTAPCLSAKVISKVLSEMHKLIDSQFSALTRHVLKIIEAIFEASRSENIVVETENITVSLTSYVSLGDKNPLDTVICAASLLSRALDMLHTGQSSSWIKNLPHVCSSVVGLLTSEASTASEASSILKDVLKRHVHPLSLLINADQISSGRNQESFESSALKATCAVFEDALSSGVGIPNEHILSVISVLFLELGEISFVLLRNIVLKLADLMTHNSEGGNSVEHLQKCFGAAVFAMGPERILMLLPISLDEHDLTYSNIWLIPILKCYVTGATLACYMDHIMPLAKSFKKASHRVKKSAISQDLQVRAHELLALLPSFCRHATDTYQRFSSLSDILITFLKKNPSMHENISMALQILVNENRSVSQQKSESSCYALRDSWMEFGTSPSYSKKEANRNIKALASCSNQLLRVLSDLFINSHSGNHIPLKGAVGCLASITDSSVTKEIFASLLKRFQFIDYEGEFEELKNDDQTLDSEPSDTEGDSQRQLILELASSLVEGANDDLVEMIYALTLNSFQAANERVHHEAYCTLSKILEEHTSFCSSRYGELIDFLLNQKPPSDIACLRSRFACFHTLMIRTMKMSLEEEVDSKAFSILNEIILTLKDGDDEARKQAYNVLLDIGSALRDLSYDGPTAPYHKLINMIMGYLSGSSPHIQSGAVSALSVLAYKDIDIFLSVSDLVPSLLSLLHTKGVEVIKAVLGFVKVIVSCLQAKDLHNFLSDIATEVLPWSSVSRHHFRSKVTVIFEIIIRKCGAAAVKAVAPGKYMGFIKTVLENRHGRSSAVEDVNNDAESVPESAKGPKQKKPKNLDSQGNGAGKLKKRKEEKKSDHESDSAKRARRSYNNNNNNSKKGGQEGGKKGNWSSKNKGLAGGGKRKVMPKAKSTGKDKAASHGSMRSSKSHKTNR